MQRAVLISILSILIIATSLLLIAQINRYNAKAKLKEKRSNEFPVTNLLSLDKTVFCTRQLAGSPVYKLIVIFDPDCDHCDFEINEITRNSDKFKNASILFISPKSVEELKKFALKMKYPGFSNIVFSLRYEELFKLFNCKAYPDIYLYGKNNKLIKNFRGKTPLSVLLSELN